MVNADILPDYLSIPPDKLGDGGPVKIEVIGDKTDVAHRMAETMLAEIRRARQEGLLPTLIVPVGPVDQFPILARKVNEERFSLKDTMLINMDEYLAEDDTWLDEGHPLSFRGYMNRRFYALLHADLAPPPEQRIFPDPGNLESVPKLIEQRGGVDACFGGIGINGHIAFNEPPEPGEHYSKDEFAALGTRKLTLARETRTINSVTVGGDISVVPRRAVTVGMKEILASRRLRFYGNRPWQSAVVRRLLHGPITPECPASFLREHPDASLTMTHEAAATPQIGLR